MYTSATKTFQVALNPVATTDGLRFGSHLAGKSRGGLYMGRLPGAVETYMPQAGRVPP